MIQGKHLVRTTEVAGTGIKQFKALVTAACMRWSRICVQWMLILRAALLGHDFDRLWLAAA
jgi:hypothetical protein